MPLPFQLQQAPETMREERKAGEPGDAAQEIQRRGRPSERLRRGDQHAGHLIDEAAAIPDRQADHRQPHRQPGQDPPVPEQLAGQKAVEQRAGHEEQQVGEEEEVSHGVLEVYPIS